ncbi:RES family NAD+ phosphorylase [Telluribacter humicola]|uniref:RES family NAD+ phosphorylase n=1 Tax=Telluribacter humicola TaxID=1720261 RepID=UPI001A96A414|nr:RES family NAD+ phosphorylase [Telluribacter humicola]
MPAVYRIQKRQHLEGILTGFGAQLYGGRWNPVGVPLVYTSSTPELALLESLVHLEGTPWEDLPPLVLVELEIPDSLDDIELHELPDDWQSQPVPPTVQHFLVPRLNSRASLAYSVPSVIMPWSRNLLLDPLHPLIHEVKTLRVEDFMYDQRLM